jgi:hypothetical protein
MINITTGSQYVLMTSLQIVLSSLFGRFIYLIGSRYNLVVLTELERLESSEFTLAATSSRTACGARPLARRQESATRGTPY